MYGYLLRYALRVANLLSALYIFLMEVGVLHMAPNTISSTFEISNSFFICVANFSLNKGLLVAHFLGG
jgi:hypothetical protein